MPSRAELETALRNAHAAGDTEAATRLANALNEQPQNGSVLNSISQGQTLGQSDEISGLIGAAMKAFTSAPNTPASMMRHGSVPEGFDTGLHNRQLANLSDDVGSTYTGVRDKVRGDTAAYAERNPGTALGAEIAGGAGTGLLGAARQAGKTGLNLIAGTSKEAGLLGLLSGAGYSEEDSLSGIAKDSLKGGALGASLGFAFPAAGQGLSWLGRKFSSIADDVGFRLTPGERFDSNILRRLETSAESFPVTSGAFSRLREQNQKQLNRIVAESIGENTDDLSGDVLGAAHARIGREFDSLTQGRQVAVDNDFLGLLAEVRNDLAKSNSKTAKKARKFIERTLDPDIDGNVITDRVYQDLSSEITGELMEKSTKGKSRHAFGQLKEGLDNLFERNLGGDELGKFRDARTQWRNLENISQAVDTGTGNVSGLRIANTLARKDKHGYLYGHNETPLYQAARASKKYKPLVGDSGTATRMSLPMMGLLGAGGYGVGSATGMDPTTMAAMAVLSPAAARLYLRGGGAPTGGLLSRPALPMIPAANAGLLTQGP